MFRDSHGVVHTVSSADPLLDLPGDTAGALAAALLRPDDADVEIALDRCEAVRELLERWQDAFFAALPDGIDLDEEARWAAEAGMSLADVEASYEGDDPDDLDPDDPDPLGLDAGGLVEVDLGAPAQDSPGLDLPGLGLPGLGLPGLGLPGLGLPGMGLPGMGLEPPVDDEDAVELPDDLVQLLERELLLLPLRVRLEALVAAAALVGTWSDLLADHEKLLGHLVLGHGAPVRPEGHVRLAGRHALLHAAHGPGHAASPGG